MSRLVGASPEEVTAMGTLTMNLHFLLASFYKPTKARYKIVLDWKAFPSDHVRLSHCLHYLCSSEKTVTDNEIVRHRVTDQLAWT